MKTISKYSLRGLGLVLIIICILWLIIVSLASCDSKPEQQSLYTFEMTLVTGKEITETYRLEGGINDFFIWEDRGSYALACYGTSDYPVHVRNGVIDFKLLKIESCQKQP